MVYMTEGRAAYLKALENLERAAAAWDARLAAESKDVSARLSADESTGSTCTSYQSALENLERAAAAWDARLI